jgi:AcrR family transcriptional regulator
MSRSSSSRSDATRNRETLIAVATRVFAAEKEPSMRAIARESGVGIGTLYRHFPTRELLVEAVYKDQLKRLSTGAEELLEKYPPAEAMRLWMDMFTEWVAMKRGMAETLRTMFANGDIGVAQSRSELVAAIAKILDAGTAAKEIRADISAEDLAANLLGIFSVSGAPEQSEQANRLLNLLMDGLRSRRS